MIVLAVGVLYRRLLWPWGHPVERLTSDFSLQFYPWLYHSTRSLLSGHVPWWTDLVGSGIPFVATLETGAFFPEHLLLGLVTAGQPSFLAAQAYQVLNVGLSGVGAYLLARELGAGWLGGLVAGVVWAATGDIAGYLIYVDRIDALVCLPFLLLLGHRALRRRSPAALAGAALVSGASLLSGHLQWALMHAYTLILLSVFWIAPSVRFSPRRWIWPLVAVAVVIGCGTLLAMPALLPAWEFFPLTSRHDYFAPNEATALAAGWDHLIRGNPFGRGGLVLMLAASAVALRRDRTAWGLATLAGLAFLLSLGDTGVLYPLAVRFLPGIGRFRFAVRFFHLAPFAVALLAGLALDRLWRRGARVGWSGLASLGMLTIAGPWLGSGAAMWSLAQGAGLLGRMARPPHVPAPGGAPDPRRLGGGLSRIYDAPHHFAGSAGGLLSHGSAHSVVPGAAGLVADHECRGADHARAGQGLLELPSLAVPGELPDRDPDVVVRWHASPPGPRHVRDPDLVRPSL